VGAYQPYGAKCECRKKQKFLAILLEDKKNQAIGAENYRLIANPLDIAGSRSTTI